jgi:16S rRNA (cytidine1402-2'-O)-methyltransferase
MVELGMKKLTLIGNHIGNHLDLSPRAVEALKLADKIIYEDKSLFDKLIKKLGISVTDDLVSVTEISNHLDKKIIYDAIMNDKNVVLITDAGYPLIADPGEDIVSFIIQAGLDIDVIPGPSISSLAVVAAGLPLAPGDFVFQEFLRFSLEGIASMAMLLEPLPQTLVIVDFPKRFIKSIDILKDILGNRDACFCIELTTPRSKTIRGTLEDVHKYVNGDLYDDTLMSTIIISGNKAARKIWD